MNELILHFLQDIYDAEKRGVRGLQKMSRAASDESVRAAFATHRDETQEQVARLERVFELVTGKRPRGKTCAAMVGLTKEADEAIAEGEKGPILDSALVASAQAVEHYEIARYSAMVLWAEHTGKSEIAELLRATLEEEKQTDAKLTEVATRLVAAEAPSQTDASSAEMDDAPKRRGRRPAAAKPVPAPTPAPADMPASAKRTRKAASPAAKAAAPTTRKRGGTETAAPARGRGRAAARK